MGYLPEADLSEMEGHLFICERCRVRMAKTEAYIAAMRRAMRFLENEGMRVQGSTCFSASTPISDR